MQEIWKQLEEFPSYAVSDMGRVKNIDTDRVLALQVNQSGVVHAGLMLNGEQRKRSVALMVVREFLPAPPNDSFDTPIFLDGDRMNLGAPNLALRPRWFARKHTDQFRRPFEGFKRPIINLDTEEEFAHTYDATVRYGLINSDLVTSIINRTYVWPTYHRYALID